MINQEILEGIKHSIARGESLAHAALTFKNAGYLENEVDDAVNTLRIDSAASQGAQPITPKIKKIQNSKISSIQQVSSYGEKPKESFFQSKGFIIFLVILLLILIGSLVTLFFFKDSITNFLNNLFP